LTVNWIARVSWVIVCCLFWIAYGQATEVDFTISGIEDGAVTKNISAFAQNIDPPAAPYQYDAYQLQLQDKALEAMQVFGYYQAKVEIKLLENSNDHQHWSLSIIPGPQTHIQNLVLELQGQGKNDTEIQNLFNSLPLKKGAPLRHADYENSKSQLQSLALYRGYFDFKFLSHQITVNESAASADISLIVDTGNRYHFGELKLDENEKAAELIRDTQPFKTGDFYLADKLSEFNRLLKNTQYFQSVLVRPLVFDAEQDTVPLEVVLSHKPRDNFDVGGGFSSDIGPRLKLKWRRPWVNASGHSMGGELFLSEPETHLSLSYRIPMEDPVQNYASIQIGYQSINDNDTNSEKFTLGLQRHWTIANSDWQRIGFIRLEQERFSQGDVPLQTTTLLIPGVTYTRLRTQGGLDVNWGDKQIITTEFASDTLGSDLNMLRISAKSQWLRSYGLHRFLLRAEGGVIETDSFSEIPSSLRYFAGGDQSIRGFGYRTLSPRNDEGELEGAQYLAVGSVEYTYPISDGWRGALFTDVGNAANDFNQDLATGIGFGVNWLSPVGPIKLYIARGHSSFDNTWRLHFSMGPAL
jgi:translocation and assembly module TamA